MQKKSIFWLSALAFLFSTSALFFALKGPGKNSDQGLSISLLKIAKENPEEFMDALKAGMAQKEEKKRREALDNLGEKKDELFNPNTPYFIGNPEGSVTFVEFFDYNCGFCKRAYEIVQEILQDHPEVRVILKEFPILGPSSELSSKVALAAAKQGKYQEAHKALLSSNKPLQTKEDVIEFSASLGLNTQKLLKDMESPEVEKELKNNVEFALALGINFTPGFISRDKMFPGMITKKQFSDLVKEELRKHRQK